MEASPKKFDIVYGGDVKSLGIVVVSKLSVPYFQDGVASDYSFKPLDIQNPKEWEQEFDACLVYEFGM